MGAAYGDFPFHMNLITSFVYGCNKHRKNLLDILSPFYAHENLAYPFIPNFYSAVLISCYDATIHDSAAIPSIIYIFSIFIILSNITFRLSKSEAACCVAPYLFIFTGGLGFTQYFYREIRKEWNIDFVHYWGKGREEFWFQTIVHILLPQRASLFSIPLAWGAISILMSTLNNQNYSQFIAVALIVGILPQVHPHSIIALMEWGSCFGLIQLIRVKKSKVCKLVGCYFVLGIIAISVGVPQFLPYFKRVESNNFMKLMPIGQEIGQASQLKLWWYALGAFFVLSVVHVPISLDSEKLSYYIPSLFVFLLSNYLVYQPWALDNTKVFNAAYIPLACAGIAYYMVSLFRYKNFGKIISIVLFIFCIASGLISVILCFQYSHKLWPGRGLEEYTVARFIIKNTPYDSIWISDSDHRNPVVCLAGRQVFLGYRGWLASHNLPDQERMAIISHLERNPENTYAIDRLNVSYVIVRKEFDEVTFKPQPNSAKWKQIYKTAYTTIYQRTK
ncbi:hypothetical protein TVAG_487690 [Trichomonas vaginalis G3]|uniref:Mannosyltransferase n=1 Tax=Trichomonas vaginalis (strain ATCC PRA-98 / G3) TaxID=412133 RepID=A2EFP7_TRIV3|nr:hypothetical protein TVAGG3_0062530 [Trichomonas vaginalis G3]EAY08542.1 hypothetical protein TVAG_487690 [Trichomonas vaginalis G3]KAI5542118.1 hypothetical protein TVAGG3_0062530 [Trichomonas vaginalis G3]|eukprot:XP_001320765.1 hypothetical protein [Trichomonas vaginalis G3]